MPFDSRRAELVFRDLAERVELRICQEIGRRLGEAERQKDHALGTSPSMRAVTDTLPRR